MPVYAVYMHNALHAVAKDQHTGAGQLICRLAPSRWLARMSCIHFCQVVTNLREVPPYGQA